MTNSFCLAFLVLISALTDVLSYSQRYRGNANQGYPDQSIHSASHVSNLGNGNNKHNFVSVDETSDGTSISGAGFTKDNSGRPSVEKFNVDINNPTYRGESQGPSVNLNPRATRTQIANIGNGVGNKNLFVFNDNRPEQAYPRNNQDNNYDYRRDQNNGYQGKPRVITNIGLGPDNNNEIYVNGKRVHPYAVNKNGVQDPSVIRESWPSVNSDDQVRESQGGVPNDNFMKPNGVTRKYRPEPQASTSNGYTNKHYNQEKITNSNIVDIYNDPSFKILPRRIE